MFSRSSTLSRVSHCPETLGSRPALNASPFTLPEDSDPAVPGRLALELNCSKKAVLHPSPLGLTGRWHDHGCQVPPATASYSPVQAGFWREGHHLPWLG